MRKILISILLGLLSIWTIYFMIYGAEALEVKGFLGLKEKDERVENRIVGLQRIIDSKYKSALVTLDSTKNTLIDSKTEYENQAELSSLNSTNYTSEKYDIDYLWTKVGNYAKDEKVVIKMEVKDTNLNDLYDLQFTATGMYSGITQFIYDIENDSELGFKIDNFSMTGANEGVTAVFECNEIHIDLKKEEKIEANEENDENKEANETNETNSVDSNTTNSTANESTTENTTSKGQNNTKETVEDGSELYNEMMAQDKK